MTLTPSKTPMAKNPVANSPTVVLHLGAHKTASTHLQQSIRDAGPALAKAGVRFYGPETLRHVGKTIPERFGFPFDPSRKRPGVDPLAELAALAKGAGRVILSEENFAGNFQRGWGKVPVPLYPQAAKRVTKLAQMLERPIDVCIAVRQPSDFLASLYSQVLLSGKVVTPEEFLIRNVPSEIDWSDYIAQMRRAPGLGALTVWRYEDYADVFDQICAAIVGPDYAALVAPTSVRTMPRLSEGAVGMIMSERLLKIKPRPAGDIALELPSGPDNPPFELFDAELRAIATAFYDAQVDAIANLPDVTVLRRLSV